MGHVSMPKSPILSQKLHEQVLKRARMRSPVEFDGVPTAFMGPMARVDPHHLRAVYPDQRRRSNPLVASVTRATHDFLHDNPQAEAALRHVLLADALGNLCGEDVACWEAAARGAIEYLAGQEATQ